MSIDANDYPYMASWFEEDPEDYDPTDLAQAGVWIHWNGISMTPPKSVRYKGKLYDYDTFKKEVWKI